jgi:hypothetical protein
MISLFNVEYDRFIFSLGFRKLGKIQKEICSKGGIDQIEEKKRISHK